MYVKAGQDHFHLTCCHYVIASELIRAHGTLQLFKGIAREIKYIDKIL